MLIPSDTAKPLNAFLNWELTLKLSDSFSLSGALLSSLLSLCLMDNFASLWPNDDFPGGAAKDTDFCLSCNPESQKSLNTERQKCG
ncbi:hypothetical protein [Agrobacterium burrii]|uniref:Uncharacterized protein n=1 Tax=Agrobacterium burrii TaxID=2815339 RepID=A0ABS3EPY6_9HYPH|nr:hypothetical protein [Agrobacterium burrii]MBO0134078.1 hypothetical protein [Agrobacterium burrii]